MEKIKKILNGMTSLIRWISVILLLIMLVITFIQVLLRYVFNNPTMWSEEVTLVMLIWFGYLVIALGVENDSHIALESLYLKFNKKVRKGLDFIRHIMIGSFSCLMVYYGVKLVQLSKAQYLPASHINRSLLYGSLLIGGILMVIYSIINVIDVFTNFKEREVRD